MKHDFKEKIMTRFMVVFKYYYLVLVMWKYVFEYYKNTCKKCYYFLNIENCYLKIMAKQTHTSQITSKLYQTHVKKTSKYHQLK